MERKIITKILSIVSFILLILVIFIIANTPLANSYEISIYDAFPWYFWIFFIGAFFLSFLVIIQEAFNEKRTKQWVFGFFVIMLGNFIFLLLHYFRGYCIYGGAAADIFTHMALINEISDLGFVGSENFYPIIHIFTLSTSNLLGIPIIKVLQFIPAIFSILYLPFMFMLGKSISKSKGQALIVTSFSIPLIFSFFHITIHPAFFSFIFLPLLLSVYHKRNHSQRKVEMSILILVLCLFTVFFHPITTLLSVIIFITFIGSASFLLKIKSFLHHSVSNIKKPKITNIIPILAISFFAWYTSHSFGIRSIQSIYKNLIYGSDWTITSHYISNLSAAKLTLMQTTTLFIFRYGAIIFYFITSFFCLIIISKKLFKTRDIKDFEFSYGMQLIITFLCAGAMIVGNFIVANPVRAMRFFIMISTVLSGLIIYSLIETTRLKKPINTAPIQELQSLYRKKNHVHDIKKNFISDSRLNINANHLSPHQIIKKKILPCLIIIIVFLSTIVCLFSVYSSPLTYEANGHFTYMNFAGSSWITDNRDIDIQISTDAGFNLWRMEHYTNGIIKGELRIKNESLHTPTHFGYNDNDTLTQVFNYTTSYMVTTEKGRQATYAFPENVRSKTHQWTDEDFKKLRADNTVGQIYSNGEFEVWNV